ncbi:MAG TPA: response regulator, partial [Candidatus Bathyarchaeia archaeon]|nr:response regulator [Candidatus Bathyarchaeia archaeon]
QFFNIALLDIKLPDMDGTQLLAKLQEIAPKTKKIIVTGYPSLKNAVEALNFGADSYIMKPIDPSELLKTIKAKLIVQQNDEAITRRKLTEWIQMQSRKSGSSFQVFLEQTSCDLVDFGLTKTQAKIYVTLVSLGVASASEVAALSKIRREEVYRIIPELEKRGIISRKLQTPRKFAVANPETAIEILTKTKLEAMRDEIDKVERKRTEIVSKLKAIELPVEQNATSIEVISQRNQAYARLTEIAQNASKYLDIAAKLENLILVYSNRPKNVTDRIIKKVKMRIITESHGYEGLAKELVTASEANGNSVELRFVERLPFSLIIADDTEAMWGEGQPTTEDFPVFWANDPTQIAILKMSFENLWNESANEHLSKKTK